MREMYRRVYVHAIDRRLMLYFFVGELPERAISRVPHRVWIAAFAREREIVFPRAISSPGKHHSKERERETERITRPSRGKTIRARARHWRGNGVYDDGGNRVVTHRIGAL